MQSDSLDPGHYFLADALNELLVSAALPQSARLRTFERLSLTSQKCQERSCSSAVLNLGPYR
jgi:hypothetical protein